MLCDKCGKNNATVLVKQVINNKETTQHLCEQCAHEIMDIGNFSMDKFFNSTSFNDIFGATIGSGLGSFGEQSAKCPVCGMSYNDFRSTGRLGCSECYSAFADELLPMVRSIHGRNQHVGKVKNGQLSDCTAGTVKPDIKEGDSRFYEKLALQKQLQELIKTEQFEEAAKIRDEIKAIDEALAKTEYTDLSADKKGSAEEEPNKQSGQDNKKHNQNQEDENQHDK